MLQAINNFTITGNLTKDPEARKTANGTTYAFITVAVNGFNKDKADFISAILWDKLALNVCKYCKKGALVSVLGHITAPTKDGKTVIQLNAENVTFLGKTGTANNEPVESPFEKANDNFQPAGQSGDIFAPI